MDVTFICLANSYKHGNRCIAGVEIDHCPESHTCSVKRVNGLPKYFRPVHRTAEGGAIPNDEALGIKILDIVRASDVVPCPDGAQIENGYYTSLTKVSHIKMSASNLDALCDNVHQTIFGNRGAAVHPDTINSVGYSVALIKITKAKFYLKDRTEYGRVPQPKVKFNFKGAELDLPITDPEFRHLIENDVDKANSYGTYYLALSLGIENGGWYSKLVAGVIVLEEKSPLLTSTSRSSNAIGTTHIQSYELFKKGFSISQIAEQRGLTENTIFNHLIAFIESGDLDVHELVSEDVIKRVSSYKRSHPAETSLKSYFEGLNQEISYNDIKAALAHLNKA